LGSHSAKPGDQAYDLMVEIGKLLAARGVRVATGAFGGVMEAAARGAKEAGGVSIGYSLLGWRTNPYLSTVIDFSKSKASEVPVELQYAKRLGHLLMADGFIIAPGGVGTIAEFLAILNLEKLWKDKKPVVLLEGGKIKWQSIIQDLRKWGISLYNIRITSSVEKAVEWVLK